MRLSTMVWLFLGSMIFIALPGCDYAERVAVRQYSTARFDAIPTLKEARKGFVTKIIAAGEPAPRVQEPLTDQLELIEYTSPVGPLSAYVSVDPKDGQRHPAIVWIHGGDCNSLEDVWTPQPRENDQSAVAFRQAGIVTMYPSLRGGNKNPGRREGFYGEVDDILAATERLASLPYVDPNRIYLGGHSTGGTMALMVAAYSNRYRAIFAFGAVASPAQYGDNYVYHDAHDVNEVALRSPIVWLKSIQSPTYVFEGEAEGTWNTLRAMAMENKNPKVRFLRVPGHTHFTLLAPMTEYLAAQIVDDKITVLDDAVPQ